MCRRDQKTGRFGRALRAARRELRAKRPPTWTIVDPALGISGFDAKCIVVVGGGGMLGSEISRSFLAQGAAVHAVDIDGGRLDELRTSLGDAQKARFDSTELDLRDTDAVQRFGQDISRLDVLVHCAAINNLVGDVGAISNASWQHSFDTMVTGPAMLTGALRPALKRERGSVVFLSSIHSSSGSPWPAYSTAKAALDKLVDDLALQFATDGVRVNAVTPGLVLPISADESRRSASAQPLGSAAIPIEAIVHAVQFLADNQRSPMTTGAHLVVDAGNRLNRAALASEAVRDP